MPSIRDFSLKLTYFPLRPLSLNSFNFSSLDAKQSAIPSHPSGYMMVHATRANGATARARLATPTPALRTTARCAVLCLFMQTFHAHSHAFDRSVRSINLILIPVLYLLQVFLWPVITIFQCLFKVFLVISHASLKLLSFSNNGTLYFFSCLSLDNRLSNSCHGYDQ